MPQSTPSVAHSPLSPVSFERDHQQSVFDYGFTQAQIRDTTCYYLVYRELLGVLDREAPRCYITMDERCVRLIEKKYPYGQVIIFTRDIVSYYKFDHSSKFVALCIDAKRREKSGYWFINFDSDKKLEAFCDALNGIFEWEKQRKADSRIKTMQCWCCGADVDFRNDQSSEDSGYSPSKISGSSAWNSSQTSSFTSSQSLSASVSTARKLFRSQ